MGYEYLIFDVDGTLLDFNLAYSRAQRTVASKINVSFSEEYVRKDEALSWKLWEEFGLDNVEDKTVQKQYHSLYKSYLQKHFECLAEEFGSKAAIDDVMNTYFEAISSSRETMEGCTLGIFEELSHTHKMIIATNGIGQIQRARLKAFLPTIDAVYISEEIGAIKPSHTFFNRILSDLECIPSKCLMIGDSISSDIIGAKKVGISTCWYNFKKKPIPEDFPADYSISSIKELAPLV